MNVSVVIPVYNAFQDSLGCIQSVLSNTFNVKQIIVIDDASPEGDFTSLLDQHKVRDSRLKVLRNAKNLGFVGTCNLGMKMSGQDDVVLLNSDTVVTRDWLTKLNKSAYSSDQIASVTPLSNNAIICSVPNFCLNNEVPLNYSVQEFADLVESVSVPEYVELVSCMGFCVYLKRSALNQVGLLDPIFGRGYGEENDLSQRFIKAGLKNVCDSSTYVYHKGNCSFLGLANELTSKNGEIIKQRYPHYFDDVSKFCASNPLKEIQNRIKQELLTRWYNSRPSVLHILNNGPKQARIDPLGGTELQVSGLIQSEKEFAHWSLVSAYGFYYLTAHIPGLDLEYIFDTRLTSLLELLSPIYFTHLHLHHNRWFNFEELSQALLEHGNYSISCHDYALVCPRFHLLTPEYKHCTGFECSSACGYAGSEIDKQRGLSVNLLNNAKQVFCFSESTKTIFSKILPNSANWIKIPHAIASHGNNIKPLCCEQADNKNNEKFKIAFLGHIAKHKGLDLIEELVQLNSINDQLIEWHIFGKVYSEKKLNIINHGEYARDQLPKLLIESKISLVCIFSLCPETYCLTLDEAWQAGVPVLVGPLGAPAERVAENNAGWVLEDLDYKTVLEQLGNVLVDQKEYHKKRSNISKINFTNPQAEATHYAKCYQLSNSINTKQVELTKLDSFIKEKQVFPHTIYKPKLLRKIINYTIYILDTVGIRHCIQNFVRKLLPEALFNQLKTIR